MNYLWKEIKVMETWAACIAVDDVKKKQRQKDCGCWLCVSCSWCLWLSCHDDGISGHSIFVPHAKRDVDWVFNFYGHGMSTWNNDG